MDHLHDMLDAAKAVWPWLALAATVMMLGIIHSVGVSHTDSQGRLTLHPALGWLLVLLLFASVIAMLVGFARMIF